MQPFDDKTPAEMDTRNAAIVSFLGCVYDREDDRGDVMEATEQEQAIAHVRQRLLQLAQTSPSLLPGSTIIAGAPPTTIGAREEVGARSEVGARLTSPRLQESQQALILPQQTSWQRRLNVLMLVAVMVVLIGGSFFVFALAQKYRLGTGVVAQNPTGTYITPPKNGSRLIGDMLYADQVSRFLLQKQQFTQINQSQMVNGYQVTLDRAYADANILILGLYAVMPYSPQSDKDSMKGAYYLPDGDHMQLATTSGIKLPVLDFSKGADMGNSKHEQRGLLLDFDTAAIAGSPTQTAQLAMNLQMNVHCQGIPPNYKCPDTVKFSFTVPFHTDRQVITPHQAVTANGVTFTLEQVVITPSEARFYIGGWSASMFKTPSIDQKHPPASYDEPWYNIKLSVQGKIYNICTLQGPLNCAQGARTGPSVPLHAEPKKIKSAPGGGAIEAYTGVQFDSDSEVNPVYLNNDPSILGIPLLEPSTGHGQATLTITKQLLHWVEEKKSPGSYGATAPVDDKSASAWNFEFALP